MSTANPTGYVRTIRRTTGPVFYAHIRTADGRRLQRKLGPAWLARSRPPRGQLTRAQAEAQLAEIMAGENPTSSSPPPPALRSPTPPANGCATSSTTEDVSTRPWWATARPSSTG